MPPTRERTAEDGYDTPVPARTEELVVIPARDGEIVGDAPDRRVEILSDDDALHATWSRFGPRRAGADLHVHREHTDLFYVLHGELTLRLGRADERIALPTGTVARVPPLVVHGFENGSDAEVRYLNLHAPGRGFADFLRALRDGKTFSYDQHPPPADGGRSPSAASSASDGLAVPEPGLHTKLLADVDEIAISEVVSEERSRSAPPHVHARHVESFYVLEGEVALAVGDREYRTAAGTWLQVPRGTPHTSPVSLDGTSRFLDLHTPNTGFGGFLRRLREAGSEEERAAARAGFDELPA